MCAHDKCNIGVMAQESMISLANPDLSFRVGTEEGLLIVLTWMNHIVRQELS